MTKSDHIEYLQYLETNYGKGQMCLPSKEGAFYFGRYISYDEYVDKYRKQCIQEGFLNYE